MEAIDVLKAARAKLALPDVWGQGVRNRHRPIETCCAAEAIEEASPYGDARRLAMRALNNAAGLEQWECSLTDWNDAPNRTLADVLKTFDLAIAILRM